MILPVLLLCLLLAEVLELIVALATPIADLFPKGTFDQVSSPVLIAVVLIMVLSFLIGLSLRSGMGRRIGLWIERALLGRLPGYDLLKSLTKTLTRAEAEGGFKPALLNSAEGTQDLVYVVEDHDDGHLTILVPWAPTPFAGFVRIVAQDRIEMLSVKAGDFTEAISFLGLGMRDLLKKDGTTA